MDVVWLYGHGQAVKEEKSSLQKSIGVAVLRVLEGASMVISGLENRGV